MTRFALEDLPPAMREQARAQMEDRKAAQLVSILRKPSKYSNEPVKFDGRTFASKWELNRYHELSQQVAALLISDLFLQVPFSLDAWSPKGPVRLGAFIADFTYRRNGTLVVEDTKSEATRRVPLYIWKRAHMRAQYGIEIVEITRKRKK
jgi:Protein of unknown function (DUF1064)